jgi:DNA-binding YbaB/EbfC family protein
MTLVPEDPDEIQEIDEIDAGAPAGFDLGSLLAQAQAMQQQLMDAQAAAADQVVEGHAGGGVVKIAVTGGLDFQSVEIDPSVIDPADVEMLQDLVLAAIRDAVAQVNDLNQDAMGAAAGGFGGALGGLLP